MQRKGLSRRLLLQQRSRFSVTKSVVKRNLSSQTNSLQVWNSLTGQKETLPRDNAVQPNVLKWYACGPTVYDRAHLGHARAYVSQDILRRILEKKFGYNVFLVMGVTDVDDKIITRAKVSCRFSSSSSSSGTVLKMLSYPTVTNWYLSATRHLVS